MRRRIRGALTFHLPVKLTKRKKWFLASCPIVDIHSQGTTEREAKKNLIEALSVFFVTCIENGTLDQVMRECGFELGEPSRMPSREMDYVDVPLSLIAAHAQAQRDGCHA